MPSPAVSSSWTEKPGEVVDRLADHRLGPGAVTGHALAGVGDADPDVPGLVPRDEPLPLEQAGSRRSARTAGREVLGRAGDDALGEQVVRDDRREERVLVPIAVEAQHALLELAVQGLGDRVEVLVGERADGLETAP